MTCSGVCARPSVIGAENVPLRRFRRPPSFSAASGRPHNRQTPHRLARLDFVDLFCIFRSHAVGYRHRLVRGMRTLTPCRSVRRMPSDRRAPPLFPAVLAAGSASRKLAWPPPPRVVPFVQTRPGPPRPGAHRTRHAPRRLTTRRPSQTRKTPRHPCGPRSLARGRRKPSPRWSRRMPRSSLPSPPGCRGGSRPASILTISAPPGRSV